MSSLFIMLNTDQEEHVKGSGLADFVKLPSTSLKLHGWKDHGD